MTFSEQNNNLMNSAEFLPDPKQIQVRETVSGVFLAGMNFQILVWHMVEAMQRDFNEHHMTQVPITENQLGSMRLTIKVTEQVGMNYLKIPDSRYVAQPFKDFLFPSEEQDQPKTSSQKAKMKTNHL